MTKSLVGLCLAIGIWSSAIPVPVQAQAQENCTCYCGGQFAEEQGTMPPEACYARCKEQGKKFVMCGFGTETPSDNVLCFTKSQCENGKPPGKWVNPQPECVADQGYCTPVSKADIELSFKLGDIGKVSDLGDYIQNGYSLLLGIAVTISIVMLMVGGIQYVLGAGMPEQVSKAKHRIQNAVIGLALLLCAYVILFTVNPQLVKLEVPAVPMAKRIEVIDESVDCDKMLERAKANAEAFKKLDKKPEDIFGAVSKNKDGRDDLCGATKLVLLDAKANEVPDGSKCQVTKCPASAGAGARCAGVGDKAACVKCEEVIGSYVKEIAGTSTGTTLVASEATCDNLSGGQTFMKGSENLDKDNQCWFSKDASAVSDVAIGACIGMTLDCSQINTCSDYDDIDIRDDVLISTGTDLEDIEARPSFKVPLIKSVIDRVNIETVCQSDPCQWHRKDTGTDKTTRCQLDERAGDDCLTASKYTSRNESTDMSDSSGAQRFE